MGPIIVTAIRLLVPLSIFRWPLFGVLASVAVDALDVIIAGAIGRGEFQNYSAFDKALDTYYLTFALIVSLRWNNSLAKRTSIVLFAYRLIGVVLFEITHIRVLLLVFPNLFENFVIFYLVVQRFFPRFTLRTYTKQAIILFLLLLLKLPQEFVLHYLEFGPWNWFHTQILGIESTVK